MIRILTASDRALLVEAGDLDEAMRLNLAWEGVPGVEELIPGARTVLVRFDPLAVTAEELSARLAATSGAEASPGAGGEVSIPVRYDGEDLQDVAGLLGVSAEEVIARHLAAQWRVAFAGFAPGFGYAVGSDPLFDVPRRTSPRTRVPAGSVGLAGTFTGVYPRESPGGWQLIGRTGEVMWDADREPPALLAPGTLVRFDRMEREIVSAAPVRADVTGQDAPHRIEVDTAPLQLLVQDLGRPGHAGLGVSASGAADRVAVRDANRAVGNPAAHAVLEMVGGGGVLRFHGEGGVAAVTGAVGELILEDDAGRRRTVPHGTPFALEDGDRIRFGAPSSGLRYVLAVRGGILGSPVLGSRAADTLAGLGPAPLRAGDVIALGDPADAPFPVCPDALPRALPVAGELVELEVTLGPREDWFTPEAIRTLLTQEWEVTSRSDRVGIRLHGERALERARAGELPSEGAVTGALQVPPEGQPVLFLPDHPLTGGYPIIGALTDRALDLAGQLPPGARIRFRTAEENTP